jgi:hypothetical protein
MVELLPQVGVLSRERNTCAGGAVLPAVLSGLQHHVGHLHMC